MRTQHCDQQCLTADWNEETKFQLTAEQQNGTIELQQTQERDRQNSSTPTSLELRANDGGKKNPQNHREEGWWDGGSKE